MDHTLSIGPLPIRLRCPEPALAAALARRYAAFLGDAAPLLTLRVAPGAPKPRPEAVALAGARAEIVGPAVAARIDLAACHAELRATPAFAVEAVEQLLRVACAMLALAGGGLLLHGAAIASAQRGYLFLGPSGAGKTTVARCSPGRRVLNDDLALLWPTAHGWDLIATPFSNPSQLAPEGPGQAALTALLHLRQAPALALAPIRPASAVAALAARAPLVGLDPAAGALLLRRARSICAIVPSASLSFLPDPGFWQLIEPAP